MSCNINWPQTERKENVFSNFSTWVQVSEECKGPSSWVLAILSRFSLIRTKKTNEWDYYNADLWVLEIAAVVVTKSAQSAKENEIFKECERESGSQYRGASAQREINQHQSKIRSAATEFKFTFHQRHQSTRLSATCGVASVNMPDTPTTWLCRPDPVPVLVLSLRLHLLLLTTRTVVRLRVGGGRRRRRQYPPRGQRRVRQVRQRTRPAQRAAAFS